MRIVIDMQGAQTESRYRGIGRYTLSFAQSIARNCADHEVMLAISGLFPETIEPIRAAFDGLVPQENIRVWYAPGPVRECELQNESRREAAELIREAFLTSLKPDVVHIASLFEGYIDDAVTSIGRYDSSIPVTVTIHDLIPLLNPEHYLYPNSVYERYYHRKVSHLRRASMFLAISEHSRTEAITHLNIEESLVVSTSLAADAQFQPLAIDQEQAQGFLKNFGINRPFVLYTGGTDERKNLPRLIRAYAGLPIALRERYQLVFVGKMSEGDIYRLRREAKAAGLKGNELCFTGFITDAELVKFYNLCELFVFPSWHEGFGLPALEAMLCGAPVIGSNTSSLPEVIGLEAALFDPYSHDSIANKLFQALSDRSFREKLVAHGRTKAEKFSWNDVGKCAIHVFEETVARRQYRKQFYNMPTGRPRLAFVSPMPPEHTGIAEYSAELLPELARYYDIEVIVAQGRVTDTWVQSNCTVRSPQWLRANVQHMDRVVYQFGNSPFHQHMLFLLEEVPGTVVLHDFFLSSLRFYQEEHDVVPYAWVRALYSAHGYRAVRERYHTEDANEIKMKYPANLDVLQQAHGVIVHSEFAKEQITAWFGKSVSDSCIVIPHLRASQNIENRAQARKRLGISENEFIVCSFGFIDPTKLNHRLLSAWLCSRLAQDKNCRLVFVGENHGGSYGIDLLEKIQEGGASKHIRITGWIDKRGYQDYLAAADLAVQLRTLSRGETSGTVLDCMSHSLATIVNANGSMAELSSNAVWMLPDQFEEKQLIEALETLWQDSILRSAIGERAKEIIQINHAPQTCAEQYVKAFEQQHIKSQSEMYALVNAITAAERHFYSDMEYMALAEAVAQSLPERHQTRQFMIDVTATFRNDLKTGIERVARALIMALLESPPAGYRVEPIYLSNSGGQWHYRYARRFTLGLLDCDKNALIDDPVEPQNGDFLLGVDISGHMLVEAHASGLLQAYRNMGVTVYFVVHDLLPVTSPQFFPPGSDVSHSEWLKCIAQYDGAVCVSRTVRDTLCSWLENYGPMRERPFRIVWSHHGADVSKSAPSRGMPNGAEIVLRKMAERSTFLMVGTIEPRKGYLQALEAFNQLWEEGYDINLAIVGHEGWKDLPDDMRRSIPETIRCVRDHHELGERLFWLEGISDEYLEKVYDTSTCLIAASDNEGFGLPLIEAAQHGVSILARDIQIFREVAGEHAFYFSGEEPQALTNAIRMWLDLSQKDKVPKSYGIRWRTWEESTRQLLKQIFPACMSRPHQNRSGEHDAKERHSLKKEEQGDGVTSAGQLTLSVKC